MIKGATNSNESLASARSVGESPAVAASTSLFGVACFLFAMLALPGALLAENVISTVAGQGVSGVTLGLPTGVATDAAGNFYIADANSCVIWKVSNGVTSVFAGTPGNCAPGSGSNPTTLAYPVDVASCNGDVYFAAHGVDSALPAFNGQARAGGSIYKVDSSGNMTLLPTPATVGGASPPFPVALACDASGNVFVALYFYFGDSSFGGAVDEIPAGGSTSQSLIANEGVAYPGVAVDSYDNVFALNAPATTAGWLGTASVGAGGLLELTGNNGANVISVGGQLENPSRLALDASGNFYITQSTAAANPTVFVTIVPPGGGGQTTFAGNGVAGYVGQGVNPTQAELNNATGMAFDGCGSLYIADANNAAVRRVSNSATASNSSCATGTSGPGSITTSISISASAAQVTVPQTVSFYAPVSVTNCPGSVCNVPLSGEVNFCFAAYDSSVPLSSQNPCTLGGPIFGRVALNGPGTTTAMASLYDYAFLFPGTYVVAAQYGNIFGNPPGATSQPILVTVCGTSCTDPGIPQVPKSIYPVALTPGVLYEPDAHPGILAFDQSGNSYLLDSAAGTISSTTVASPGGVPIFTTTPIVTGLNNPSDMVLGSDGNLYVTNTGLNQIIKITGPATATPVVTVIAPALATPLNSPTGIIETGAEVYVTDTGNNRVVAFRTDGSFPSVVFSSATAGAPVIGLLQGIVVNPNTLAIYIANAPAAGSSSPGNIIVTSIGGSASTLATPGVTLQSPVGLALDPSNGLYFSDTGTHQIYRMDVAGHMLVVGGNGTTAETPGSSATQTGLANPTWLALDQSNSVWFTDGTSGILYVDTTQAQVNFTAAGQSQTIFLTSPISAIQGSVEYGFPSQIPSSGSADFQAVTGAGAGTSTCNLTPPSTSGPPAPMLSPNTSCTLVVQLSNTATPGETAEIDFLSEIAFSLGPFNPASALTQKIKLNFVPAPGSSPLQISPSTLPRGTFGSAFGPFQLLVYGGNGVLKLTQTGALPPGVTFSSNTLSGTPTQTGVFSFTITASDTNGDSASQAYSVTIDPAISVTPASPTILTGSTQQFTASVAGTTSTAVTWSVLPGGAGGTISSSGLYTAPSRAGTDNVIATSVAFPGATAFATVAVTGTPPPISIFVPETITTTDTSAFLDIAVSEHITVSDQVAITPLIGIAGVPAAAYSASSLGFDNIASSTQYLTVSDVGQAALNFVDSYSITPGFSVGPIQCSDGTTTMPISLLSGSQCTFSITYAGTSPTGTITFTDNAALSSPASTPAPPKYTQTIQLNGAAPSSVPVAPPSAMVTIPTIYESITVEDTPSTNVTSPSGTPKPATLTSPTLGSTLGISNVHFTWTTGTEVTQYDLWLGLSGPGSSSLYTSGWLTTTSTTVISLPAKGAKVFARLYSLVNGTVQYNDYTYTEAPVPAGSPATMITPAQASTLGTSNVMFTWTAGTGETQYDLWLGLSGPGSSSLYTSGWLTTMSTTVISLPAKGARVFARLYSLVNGAVKYNDYTYTEQ